MMRKLLFPILIAVLLLAASAVLSAQEYGVIYTEGWVDIKDNSGEIYELLTGDSVLTGDTIITGEDGLAELEPSKGSRIVIKPETIFCISENELGGIKKSVISATLGEISFKFNNMVNEPIITTPSAVMGIRGTEFTLYAGSDASSLVIVESGSVEVSGNGKSVILEKEEGVEISANGSPGEKFNIMGKPIDYSEWNTKKTDKMMQDPLKSLANINSRLEELITEAENWHARHEEYQKKIEGLRKDMTKLFDEGKDKEARDFYDRELFPIERESLYTVINYRYYALSALSMRQYILSGLYIRMKTSYLGNTDDMLYKTFNTEYNSVKDGCMNRIMLMLEETDF